jgi:hypothetical protein
MELLTRMRSFDAAAESRTWTRNCPRFRHLVLDGERDRDRHNRAGRRQHGSGFAPRRSAANCAIKIGQIDLTSLCSMMESAIVRARSQV